MVAEGRGLQERAPRQGAPAAVPAERVCEGRALEASRRQFTGILQRLGGPGSQEIGAPHPTLPDPTPRKGSASAAASPEPLGAMRASPACKGPGSAACTFQCRLRAAGPAALQPRPSRCSAARATPTHCSASFVSEEPSTSGRLADREQCFNGSGPQSSSGGRPTDGAGRPWRSGNTPTGWHPLAQPLIWQVGACGIMLHWSGLGLCCAQWGRAFQVGPRPCWAPQQCCCSE